MNSSGIPTAMAKKTDVATRTRMLAKVQPSRASDERSAIQATAAWAAIVLRSEIGSMTASSNMVAAHDGQQAEGAGHFVSA